MSLLYPKLRWPIDISVQHAEGQEVIVLRCPLGISPEPLILVRGVGPILSCLEGALSLEEIESKFAPYGVKRQTLDQLTALLDQHLFLATPRFFEAQRRLRDDFARAEVRPAALAGLGYAHSGGALRLEIEKYLEYSQGAGRDPTDQLIGLVSPHIDYRRGQVCYGKTYHALRHASPELFVLIGTSHQYSDRLFHLTRKHFATPLGQIQNDTGFVDRLARAYGEERSFADEFLHRREHSLELQVPFLNYLAPHSNIVPILVGSFHKYLRAGKLPDEYPEYDEFAHALTEELRAHARAGRKLCFLAGVDMAHIGKHFGDSTALTPHYMEQIALRDQEYLNCLARGEKQALFAHVASDLDARRICGFPTMYLVLDVLERLTLSYSATTFDYRQAVDYESDCAVTFAGVGFYRPLSPAGSADGRA